MMISWQIVDFTARRRTRERDCHPEEELLVLFRDLSHGGETGIETSAILRFQKIRQQGHILLPDKIDRVQSREGVLFRASTPQTYTSLRAFSFSSMGFIVIFVLSGHKPFQLH